MLSLRFEPAQIVAMGINHIVEHYCFEMERNYGVVFPKGDQHIGFTRKQMDEFDHFREALGFMSRARYDFVRFDLALKTWLKDCPEVQWRTVEDYVDCDGWVKLTPRELSLFLDWKEYKWHLLNADDKL